MKRLLQGIAKKKVLIPLVAAGLLLIVLVGGSLRARGSSAELVYATVELGNLTQTIEASGMVRAKQTADLAWKISGTVESVAAAAGQQVEAGQVLTSLEKSSLSAGVILAQARLVNAERELEELKTSRLGQAEAMNALEEARQAWEDAQNPLVAQADAQNAVAAAQQELDKANRLLAVTASVPSADAISQANANLLLAENVYNQTLENIERIQKRLHKPESAYMFFESRELYRGILDSLEQKEIRDRRAYEKAQEKYNQLLEPVDPLDLAVAEANVVGAMAALDNARRQWERIQDGYSAGDLAVLEAQLRDAEREWERLKDGPDAGDLTAAEARVAAAQAVLTQVEIKAPFSGVITRVDTKVGDQVRAGTSAMRLDDLTHLYVDVHVSEIDISQVRVGQTAVLTFDSIPVQKDNRALGENTGSATAQVAYTGTVVAVARVGTEVDETVQYDVVIEIDQPDGLIHPGVSADATIVVNEIQDVVKIPNEAVYYTSTTRVVFVARAGQPEAVVVDLEAVTTEYSQLVAGDVQPGDRIVMDPPEWLTVDLEG
ncbi:MAG TPA: efflux RND transporter periplasmic adaptor subunit [Anaerolineales bacterium]|nr:efflux RND transporter periplasmic adaptor subunit [Anaerolineales bacterium]